MAWQWQQSGPVSFDHSQDYLPSSQDEKRAVSFDVATRFDVRSNEQPIGTSASAYAYPPHGYGHAYQQSYHHSSSNFDAPGPSLSLPQSSSSSSNPYAYETASLPDAERLITPGLYPFPAQYDQYAPAPSQPAWQQDYYSSSGNYYVSPVESHVEAFPGPSQAGPSTISPTALGQGLPKATKSFSEIMMNSRASSSSASSTEGGHEWSGSANVFDDWARPVQRALDVKPLASALDLPTVPEPSSRRPYPNHHYSSSTTPMPGTYGDSHVDAALRQYIDAPNRLAFGERKIMVMSPKVGQKSYGNEKRFLCPHPQATLIGAAWWRKASDSSPLLPPRINIALAGEQPVKDTNAAWYSVAGKSLNAKLSNEPITADDQPFLGTVAGRNLHISDNDGKRREVKALVTVKAPLRVHSGWGAKGAMMDIGNEEVIGTFESKEIKVISKPSKKKSSTKSGDLIVTHGSTIALFNRVKSQTTSTRYLSVVPDYTRIQGSDGQPVYGAAAPPTPSNSTLFPGFTANASVWESFIVWLVNPSKPAGPGTAAPLHPDWPSAPANALASTLLAPPVRYNSTIVLQSLQNGICSPTLVIRRIEQDADVVGMDGTYQDAGISTPEGELPGDLVSQLQKVAFEVYRPERRLAATVPSHQLQSSLWLSCDQEITAEKIVTADKRWAAVPTSTKSGSRPNSTPTTPSQRFGVLPMTPHTSNINLPSTPSSPVSSSSSLDYFGAHSRKSSSSALFSPNSAVDLQLPSTDGGPVRRQRTGSTGRAGPLSRPQTQFQLGQSLGQGLGHRKKVSADNSASSSYEHIQAAVGGEGKMFWTMDVGDVCVWSIVSTEQVTYTFYVPPYVDDVHEPVTPLPSLSRLLPPNMAADNAGIASRFKHEFTSRSNLPLVTIYGKNFVAKADHAAHHLVYFGEVPAAYNEVRCSEIMAAAEPDGLGSSRRAIYLVRDDGRLVVPTNVFYPPL